MAELELPSKARRKDILHALRTGTVPDKGLEWLAVGLDRFEKTIGEELSECAAGRSRVKAVRGDYGTGKTFFSRYFAARALALDMAVTEVQVSEVDTPLYRLETVYRRALEHLRTKERDRGAFRQLVERWFFDLEEEALATEPGLGADPARMHERVALLLEERLRVVAEDQPAFSSALRAAHRARLEEDEATFEGLVAWLMGQPHVAATVKRKANLKADLDHTGALAFLRGLLLLLKQTGRPGLVLVLDEVETIQRVRGDSREKSLNALRQLLDAIGRGDYPGLYLVITGTPAFYDGPQGVQRLPPLAARLHTDFDEDSRFDNPRAVQVRLLPFNEERLVEVGKRVRELYPADHPERIRAKVTDDVLRAFARNVAGKLGQRTGIAPRLFLKKLVDRLLDRVDQFEDFEPREHLDPRIAAAEMTAEEATAAGIARSPDDIVLNLRGEDDG
ncbi:BREX system ATP-binding protein BrxD [Polyangium jinanense]|uniref:BREX system ATP-binding protein BrxD n=1 Tax=Polyangium jinanense TaxID=2829994 RepID=A0A9X3XFD5_9BACT|nr:BREX system ATP-binding protein BrxD [Polyangium jinanense]MDC3988485.1 BREX system ATP-binding protein BrxD [Polyangium jinanense]